MWRPNSLIDVAAEADEQSYRIAFSGFLDSFYSNPNRRQTMIEPEPPLTGDDRRDAYMAAAAEHLARRWGLRIPDWTDNSARSLHEPWFTTDIEALKPLLLAQSPLAFRKRMIFVEHEPLSRARMPR
jgi:hypothetical protein